LAVITAPEKRCGKSVLLQLIGEMVLKPLSASCISPAALYRAIDAWSPTLLIDEFDTFADKNEPLRGVLNSGHTRHSAFTIVCSGDDNEPTRFGTWGAKALAGIGKLPETVMDRSILLELRRKLPHEQVSKLRHNKGSVFEVLSSKLMRFSQDHSEAIRYARPNMPDSLNDRAADNWEPLLAIA
jgi:putative DNA primase/helicase